MLVNSKKTLSTWAAGLTAGSLVMVLDNACTLTYEELDQILPSNKYNVRIKRGPFSTIFVQSFISAGFNHAHELFSVVLSDPRKMIDQQTLDDCAELLGDKFTMLTEE